MQRAQNARWPGTSARSPSETRSWNGCNPTVVHCEVHAVLARGVVLKTTVTRYGSFWPHKTQEREIFVVCCVCCQHIYYGRRSTPAAVFGGASTGAGGKSTQEFLCFCED
ncbi:unnamed protein product [Pylaiella littoralis]